MFLWCLLNGNVVWYSGMGCLAEIAGFSVNMRNLWHAQESGARNLTWNFASFFERVSCFLAQVFSCASFLHQIECSSVRRKKLACTWPNLWGLIGGQCFWLASCVVCIVNHVYCTSVFFDVRNVNTFLAQEWREYFTPISSYTYTYLLLCFVYDYVEVLNTTVLNSKQRIRWSLNALTYQGIVLPFSGIPFIFLGNRTLSCHHGPDLNKSSKIKQRDYRVAKSVSSCSILQSVA